MPVTSDLPYSWYDTPNIHFCTIRDFVGLCDEIDAKVERAIALNGAGQKIGLSMRFWNFFGPAGGVFAEAVGLATAAQPLLSRHLLPRIQDGEKLRRRSLRASLARVLQR